MADLLIRPSLKQIRVAYAAVFVLLAASVAVYYATALQERVGLGVALLPGLLLLWPIKRHLTRQFTRMTVSGGTLRYESGIISRTKRLIQVAKVQDVRVDQTLTQRLLDVGRLSIETAGETSQLAITNVDSPDHVAEDILRVAHAGAEEPKGKSL
jgi:uncharacterized membrane protein YdbT with pleckstrin-like domain